MPNQQGVLETFNLLKGKWIIPVMAALALGECQNGEVLTIINDGLKADDSNDTTLLSHRVLADTLQRATEDGLIERRGDATKFTAVYYRLTPKGRSLLRAIRPLVKWSQQYNGLG